MSDRRALIPSLAVLAMAAATATSAGAAERINTGEADGAWHTSFCPILQKHLATSRFSHACTPTAGAADSIARVAANPAELGFAQLDVFALEVAKHGGASAFTRLRVDDARECVFAVTRNRDLLAWGDLAGRASQLRFVLPPATSGGAGTFRYLQSIDRDGVGRAKELINAQSIEEAVRTALSADDAVALFVAFPDPDHPRFKLITELGGHVVPVLDRTILRQQIEDRKIYFASETQVVNAGWLKAGTKVVTACTPQVVFTGAPERIRDDKARQEHKDLIATVVTLRTEDLVPRESMLEKLVSRSRELSGASVDRLIKLSEEARVKAGPWLAQMRALSEKAMQAAGPAFDKAKELSAKAYEKLQEEGRQALEKALPGDKKPAEEKRPQTDL